MGQFSYDCTKCGKHSQFDWIDDCVVKIGDIHVEGTYNGYGQVEVIVLPDPASAAAEPDIDTADKIKPAARTIEIQLEQYRQFFPNWDVTGKDVVGTEIYCNGDCDANSGNDNNDRPGKKKDTEREFIKMHQMSLAVMLGMADADEYVDRCCVPSRLQGLVQPCLLESDLDGLPTASMVEDGKTDDKQRCLKRKVAAK